MSVQASNACSHGWRSILVGRDLLLTNTGKTIGNGRDTSIWNDPWLSTTTLARPMGPPEQATKDLKVADLLSPATGGWDKDVINRILPHEAPTILCLKPSKTGVQDKHCWIKTKNGEYSTKTGYYSALDKQWEQRPAPPSRHLCNWMKDVWTVPLSPKLQIFLWKIMNGALPLGESLEKRGLRENIACVHCGARETATHLFLQCPFAMSVWSSAPIHQVVSVASAPDFPTALKLSRNLPNLPPTGMRIGPLFPWIIWSIWTARNLKIFENRSFSPSETLTKAIADAREWQDAQQMIPPTLPQLQQPSRHPSGLNTRFTIFTDAAWRKESLTAGLAWSCTDNHGNIVFQGSTPEPWVESAQLAEGLAIREALLQAQAQGLNNITIKSDAQIIIRAINNRESIKELFGTLHDIHRLSCDLDVVSFIFIPRTENSTADALAKRALLNYSLL